MKGIYVIKNIINGKVYVGSSKDIKRRFKRHKTDLKHGNHTNVHLARAYKKYGVDSFVFIIVELCKESELLTKEEFYMIKYDSLNIEKGYNLKKPMSNLALENSETFSEIISKAMKGRKPSNHEKMKRKRWKPVLVFIKGKLKYEFESLRSAERYLEINRGNIYNYLKGKTKGIKGFTDYHFEYKD